MCASVNRENLGLRPGPALISAVLLDRTFLVVVLVFTKPFFLKNCYHSLFFKAHFL